METRLVVIGASTALREVQGIVSNLQRVGSEYRIVGVVDDDPSLIGGKVSGLPVLGNLAVASTLHDVSFVFAIGSLGTQHSRANLLSSLGIPRERFVSLIHPSVDIDPTASIGHGCILHKGVSLGPGANVKDFVVIAVNSALGPDVEIEDFAMVASSVLLLTKVRLGRSAYVGSMTCILENVCVGVGARIGAGSIVSRDVPDYSVAIGNPARILGRNV